jgi:type IV pilus assembly protein PilM
MLSFVKGLSGMFSQKANPIGVDFGSDSLKMAQVEWENGEPQLIAAASAEVPGHVRHNAGARLNFFAEAARELLTSGKFKGRQAILALPAASMFIQHLRLAKMDDELLKKALPWEARGKLPIDPSHALMRHVVAGEIYQDQEPKAEVILMAAARELVNQLLTAATKAKLDIIGMGVEPSALVDCFGHIYRRQEDRTAVSCFVDIGCASSRAVIAQGAQLLFARSMKIGGEHLTRAVASNLKMNMDDARMLRLKLCYQQPAVEDAHRKQEVDDEDAAPAGAEAVAVEAPMVNRGAKLRGPAEAEESGGGGGRIATAVSAQPERRGAPVAPRLPSDPRLQQAMVDEACREPLNQLAAELDLCRRYYESTFPNKPVDRLVFVGGEARHRTLCQHVAREMSLAAQVGDPLVRMGRTTNVGIDSGLDRRQAQPGWAVAIGLSLGPCAGSQVPGTVEAK